MIKVTVIAVGRLKEKYLTAACDEYLKRLSAYSKVNIVEINEERCSDNPSHAEIARVIEKEGERIISKIPKGSFVIPLCIEGSQLSSEDFSKNSKVRRFRVSARSHSLSAARSVCQTMSNRLQSLNSHSAK